MTQQISLYGGPMHGEIIDLPDNQEHFHIMKPVGPPFIHTPGGSPESVATREGMYSRVRNTRNFEWDGWRGHE